jgi:hypothetical protein
MTFTDSDRCIMHPMAASLVCITSKETTMSTTNRFLVNDSLPYYTTSAAVADSELLVTGIIGRGKG